MSDRENSSKDAVGCQAENLIGGALPGNLNVLKNHRPNTPVSGFIQAIMIEAAKNTLLKTGDPELKEAVERIEKIQEGL